MTWQTRRFRLDLARPLVMGIVNVTPDSFSDGGRFAQADAARAHCDLLLAQGADILDIGGESTRPGARLPDTAEQLARVRPVLEHAVTLGVPVSVDTADPVVMREALAIGVDILNDVRALQAPGALEVAAADPAVGVCLMHMQGEPGTMQAEPRYDDVVAEVAAFLAARAEAAIAAGVVRERIWLDPGIGFGKHMLAHNLPLLAGLDRIVALGFPVLLGVSRKSFIGAVDGEGRAAADQRLGGSIAAALAGVAAGVAALRVHDVRETVQALRVWTAIAQARSSAELADANRSPPR